MNHQHLTSHKIVVTGAEGFLGRKVVARLAGENHTVVAVDRIAHTGPALPGVIYHQADLSVADALLPTLADDPPFILVHLAWDMRRHLGYAIQAEQVRQFSAMLDTWTDRGLSRLVAMGSAEEYGGCDGIIPEEASPVLPLSPYGWAKRASHDLAGSWSAKCNIPVVWLRPFIVYGPGQTGDMMIPYAIECARNQKDAQFSDGRQCRDFIYIDDVVEAIALSVAVSTTGFHVCNIGSGKPVAVSEVLVKIAQYFNAASHFHLGAKSRRPGEPDVQVASVAKSKDVLGWTARMDLMQGLDQTLGFRHS